ncbi:MAG: type II/IV secretion system ATPase subunit [Burkholderiales bacterium]|nr:type II/IV secretion system ATPase subunit [Anaerolineae bacterium]
MSNSDGVSDNGNGHNPTEIDADELRRRLPKRDADKGREPNLVPGLLGHRLVSIAALLERIEGTFMEEFADTDAMREANTRTKKLQLILETANYILAVESVQLAPDEKAELIRRAYSNIFTYGPLDALFADERITTISLEGVDKISARYGHADLVPLSAIFEDESHLRSVVGRMVRDSGAELRFDQPYIEAGFQTEGRPISINLVAPPVTMQLTADIRLHPANALTLDDLVETDFMTPEAAILLRALMASPHGFVIAGDVESGKTTLLTALARELPRPLDTVSVERAGELRLPEGVKRLTVQWPVKDEPGISFGDQIGVALQRVPACILLDEVRADEPESIAPLLTGANAPRQIWTFRGAVESKRLRNALGLFARRADATRSDLMARALYERIPFVVSVRWKRFDKKLQLRSVGEWQFLNGNNEYPEYVLLMENEASGLALTGKRSTLALGLPEEFWNAK